MKRPPIAIVACWLLLFGPSILAGRVFYFRDLFYFHRPLREAVVRAIVSGQAPFLNPWLNLGQPMLADPSYTVFYPATLLFLVLPFGLAWNLSLSGHVLWGALGAYLLLRELGSGRPAATAASLVFAASGPFLSTINYWGLLLASSWIPWVFATSLRAWRRGGASTVLASLALAAMALAGEPTVLVVTSAVVATAWLGGLVGSVDRARLALRGGLVAGIGVLLAAPQIVPALAWLPETDRAAGLPFRESAAWWSLHPERLAEVIAPGIVGNAMGGDARGYWGGHLSDSGFPYFPRLYLGCLPLIVAPLAWRSWRGRAALAMGVSGLALSLGHHLPGYELLYDGLPPFWLIRYPEKFAVFGALGLVAAFGLACAELRERRFAASLVAFGSLVGFLLWLAVGTWGVPDNGLTAAQEAIRSAAVGSAAILVILATALVVLAARGGRVRRVAFWTLLVFAVLDVAWRTRDVAATRPGRDDGAEPRVVQAVPALRDSQIVQLGEVRPDAYFSAGGDPYVAMQEGLQPWSAIRWSVGYGATTDVARSMSSRSGRRLEAFLARLRDGTASDALRSWGISWIVAPWPVEAAGIVPEATVRPPGGPPVHVYRVDPPPKPLVRLEGSDATPRWEERAPHRIVADLAGTRATAMIVARDAIPGWAANADGVPAAIEATGDGLIRVPLPRGASRVVVAYEPPGLRLGLALGGLGLAGAIAAAAASRRSRRPAQGLS